MVPAPHHAEGAQPELAAVGRPDRAVPGPERQASGMNETPPLRGVTLAGWPALRRLLLAFVIAVIVVGSGWIGFTVAERKGIATLRQESNHRLHLFSSGVEGVINRLEHVPATVQLNQDVLELLRRPRNPNQRRVASDYLRRLNAHLG